MKLSESITRMVASAMGGATVVVLGVGAFSPQALTPAASATDAKTCLNATGYNGDDDYGQIDAHEADATAADMRGVRSDVFVSNGAMCQRISSVAVISVAGGQFEVGWIIGWWGPSPCSGVDHDVFYSTPTLFNVHVNDAGGYGCKFFSGIHPPEGTLQNFRGSDTNANTYWGSWYNGIEEQPSGVNMDFSTGTGAVNMERGAANDGGYADWESIQEYHPSNGWTNFDDLRAYYNHDPDWTTHIVDGHTMHTVAR